MAAIPQFSDEQRAFVVLNYEKYKPSGYKIFVRISQDFAQKFPGSRIHEGKRIIHFIWVVLSRLEVRTFFEPFLRKICQNLWVNV